MNSRTSELLSKAISLHQANNLNEAGKLCRLILAQNPKQFPALTLLGTIALQCGNLQEAVRLMEVSLAINPKQPGVLSNLGLALNEMKLYPRALANYDRAIALNPRLADAYNNRGITLSHLGKYKEAISSCDRAIALNPHYAEAYINRGSILTKLARYEEALVSYDRAVSLNPAHAETHYNRGVALAELSRSEEALASYDRAIALNPRHDGAYINRGIVLTALDRHEEALTSYDHAIALNPGHHGAHVNRGVTLAELNRLSEALASYDHAFALSPDDADANLNTAYIKILLGQYEEGWKLFEWRNKHEDQSKSPQHFPKPLWLGQESLAGKTILLHLEQGIGDTIQFCRFAPLAEALGAKVILQTQPALAPLLNSLEGTIEVIPHGSPLPAFDLHCPMMSLPLAFKTTVNTIPKNIPYLKTDPSKQKQWRNRIGIKSRQRVGLVWSGGQGHKNDRNRSISLKVLTPLLDLNFEFHCLQKEIRPIDIALLSECHQIRTHENELNDFSDTAALIAEMDLVISVDTSVAHLAGALGKPVWILLPFAPDYRWMMDRDDSPWYPTARLFRQPRIQDWTSVMSKVAAELEKP